MNEKSGFRRGAIRMEYVIIAVLIAAAIILALLFFGRSVANSVGVAGQAATGAHSDTRQWQSMQEERSSGHTAAKRANKFFEDSQGREAVEMTQERKAAETSVRAAEVDIPLSDDDRGRERNDVK